MADSDGEYMEELSDDEFRVQGAGDSTYGTRSKGGPQDKSGRKGKGGGRGKAAWEDIHRSWEGVTETADGSISIGLLEAEKRKRLLKDTTPLQRGIIRHLIEYGYRRLSYSIRLFQYLARAPVCRDVYLHYRSSPS